MYNDMEQKTQRHCVSPHTELWIHWRKSGADNVQLSTWNHADDVQKQYLGHIVFLWLLYC